MNDDLRQLIAEIRTLKERVAQLEAANLSLSAADILASVRTTGTWTPTIKCGGANTGMTFYSQAGKYIKLGNWVGLSFSISVNAKGSSTGVLTLEGLPFSIVNTANYYPAIAAVYARWTLTAGYKCAALGVYNTAKANIYQVTQGDSGSLTQLTDANLPGDIYGLMWYLAA